MFALICINKCHQYVKAITFGRTVCGTPESFDLGKSASMIRLVPNRCDR